MPDINPWLSGFDVLGEAPMPAVETHQMRVRFNWPKVVDGDGFNIGAAAFDDSVKNIAPDPAKPLGAIFTVILCLIGWACIQRRPSGLVVFCVNCVDGVHVTC